MAKAPPQPTRRRRRGPELEAALLEAAWEELVEFGFAKLTMESVAARAHTGIAVLYRRWPNKEELAFAAIEHFRRTHPVEIPDTGTLRGDLLALLKAIDRARGAFFAAVAASGLLADTGLTPGQARHKFLGDQPPWRDQLIFRRADERGEIDLDRIPDAVLAMPFDLMRHDMMLNLEPLKPARMKSIVDELFLPLVLGG
ncbi:MAG: TetR/AcrR family transcriptional regulator [Solirubrobacterales bacterium]